jgi:hypothetical protein
MLQKKCSKSTSPKVQALRRPLLASHLLICHWPKQLIYQRVIVEKDYTRDAGLTEVANMRSTIVS